MSSTMPATTPRATVRWARRVRSWAVQAIQVLAVAAVVFPIAAVFAAATLPKIEGGAAIRVQGASMGKTYPLGSLALTRPMDRHDVRRGDVVLVARPDAFPILHRVIAIRHDSGRILAVTKGDANPEPDPKPVALGSRVLVAERMVPYAGYLFAVVTTPAGWVLLMVAPAALLTSLLLVDIWWPKPRRSMRPGRRHTARVRAVPVAVVVFAAFVGSWHVTQPGAALFDGSDSVGANTFGTASTFP